jgi:hypothetical protein
MANVRRAGRSVVLRRDRRGCVKLDEEQVDVADQRWPRARFLSPHEHQKLAMVPNSPGVFCKQVHAQLLERARCVPDLQDGEGGGH